MNQYKVGEDDLFTDEEAVELYSLLLNPGIGVKSDATGDWFIAEDWATGITGHGETPIIAARNAAKECERKIKEMNGSDVGQANQEQT